MIDSGHSANAWFISASMTCDGGPGDELPFTRSAKPRSTPDGEDPDLQLHFTPVGYKLTPDALILLKEPAVTGIPNVNRPYSRGWIELRSGNFRDPPRIEPRLLDDKRDVDILIRGCEIIRQIFSAPPLVQHVLAELVPGPSTRSRTDWEEYLRTDSITIFHPCGTCKMGIDQAAVVDPELKVHGVDGLSIADASIMPHLVSGNINAPTIMIGEKAADLILQRGKS